jgi:hypothetical protein
VRAASGAGGSALQWSCANAAAVAPTGGGDGEVEADDATTGDSVAITDECVAT